MMLLSSTVPRDMMMRPLAEMLWNAFKGVFFTKPSQTAGGGREGERESEESVVMQLVSQLKK